MVKLVKSMDLIRHVGNEAAGRGGSMSFSYFDGLIYFEEDFENMENED